MSKDIETCKKTFREAKLHGLCSMVDFKKKLEDFDKNLTDLHEDRYIMGPMESKVLIKKFGVDRTKAITYSLIKNIHHTNTLSVKNFYDEVGQPRFVLSWVDGSISGWIKSEGANLLFKKAMTGKVPTTTFRQIIIDLCAALEHLFKEGIYPVHIGAEDLYMRKAGRKTSAQLLICPKASAETDEAGNRNIKEGLWKQMRDAVKQIFKDCLDSQNSKGLVLVRFFDHIVEGSAKKMENYPLDWNEEEKAKYLLKIMAMDKSEVEEKVKIANIGWPPATKSGKLPSPLREMENHEMTRDNPSTYDVNIPYDYMRICKNMIKHWWVLPQSVKDECSTWEWLVKKMDMWDPLIWCKLYEVFG